MAQIERISGFNKESDVFVYLIEELEKDNSFSKKIYRKAWDMLQTGRRNNASAVILPLCKQFVKKDGDGLKEYVLEKIDRYMMVQDPKFLLMCAKILSIGIVKDMQDMPMRYKKYLSSEQKREVEEYSAGRGKEKLRNMLQNRKGSKKIANTVILNKRQDKVYSNFISSLEALVATGIIDRRQFYDIIKVIKKSTKKFIPLSSIEEFKKYFFDFYDKDGIYPIEGLDNKVFAKGLRQYLSTMGHMFEGDSIDREHLRDIIFDILNKGV